MRKYELMYIIRPDLEQEAVDAVVERIKEVIASQGGELLEHEVLGKRRLAYEIQKLNDGIYVLAKFQASPSAVNEIERVIRITDSIIRHLVVKDVAS